MNIIFFGSDDFAAVHLKSLIRSPQHVVACVTQPDRPKGRGMHVIDSLVKEWARTNKIPVLQPEALNDSVFMNQLKSYQSDIFVVVAYGKFLPKAILDIPSHGGINVHASLLPKYRGAAPINWAIINGEKESGVSVIQINERMDAGDILGVHKIKIMKGETAISLRARMMEAGPALLEKTLMAIAAGKSKPVAQEDNKATLAPKLIKALGHIPWNKSAVEILNLIRGVMPWPGAYTEYNGKMLKILEAAVVNKDVPGSEPGEIVEVNKNGLLVSTGRQGLLVEQVHLQDSKPMDAHSFLVGHELKVGYKFN
jgi:methionyl-tRNA formyltransferase